MKKRTYISDIPELLAEWDWNKNKGLSPDKVSSGCDTMVHWICPVCHGSYPAYPYNRKQGKGCPYCAGRKVLLGFNDLRSQYPLLAEEWDYDSNGNLTPETITAGSSKEIIWICNNGHSYSSSIPDRRRGDGCPFCSGRKLLVGFNDLATTHPKIVAEWHPTKNGKIKPQSVSKGMTDSVWWKCSQCGHEWLASPNSRTRSKGSGCPECGKEKQKKSRIQTMLRNGGNSLATSNPFLASEWHPTKNKPSLPSQFTRSSSKKVWWSCTKCGNEWFDTINHRSRGRGCPECSGRSTSFSEQAVYFFVKKYFDDAISRDNSNGFELDIYIPSLRVGIEYDGSYFHGANKHGMSDSKKDNECLRRKIKLYRIREKGLESTKNAICIMREKDNNDSLEKCIEVLLAHLNLTDIQKPSISANLANINNQYTETFKKNSLSNLRPDIAVEWHPTLNGALTPDQVFVRSGRLCYWICPKCGKPYAASVATRTAGHGCQKCARKLVGEKLRSNGLIKGENDFATLYPELAAEWDYTKNEKNPSEYLAGSK